MKKTLLLMAAALMLTQTSFAAPCGCGNACPVQKPCDNCKQYTVPKCECDKPAPCQEKKVCEDEIQKENRCFFDKQFAEMKKVLCLSPQQETNIDCIYAKFKKQMQALHDDAAARQKKLCCAISECADNSVIKEQKEELKEIRSEAKDQYKCFSEEVKSQLCKDQIKSLNKFNREERRKMKKLAKYCMAPKFPCDCGCQVKKPCDCGCN